MDSKFLPIWDFKIVILMFYELKVKQMDSFLNFLKEKQFVCFVLLWYKQSKNILTYNNNNNTIDIIGSFNY